MRHPSGRPRRVLRKVGLPIERVPSDEPLTPGLRKKELQEAIGFVTHFRDSEYEDDCED